jgi:restriction system protein
VSGCSIVDQDNITRTEQMSVPDFQTMMLPLLKIAGDGQEHTLSEAIETLAQQFKLTDADRRELLPSGKQSKFVNRVGWSATYLRKTKLLEGTGKGRFRITERGQTELRLSPQRIDLRYLDKYPELADFRRAAQPGDAAGSTSNGTEAVEVTSQTPREVLEASYQLIRRELAQDLLERIKQKPPVFFERLVVELLVAMGYGGSLKDAGQAVGRSGDGGIDGVIKEDKLGLDFIYIQAKRWDSTVGRPVVQAFAGALDEQKARKGVIITTSNFSQEAHAYVKRIERKIVLIDGEQLAQLMIDYNVGVAEEQTYTVKKIDLDYFGDE